MADKQEKEMAVLFADISSSTRLFDVVGDDEARRIETAWLAQVNAILPRFDGRLVKTVGDEVMCVFPSADQGVLAASAMQAEVTAHPPGDNPITLHMGLHWGKVIVEGSDVFGGTVNIAAYLTDVASTEQIVVTDDTVAALSDPLKFVVRPVFRTILKGQTNEVIVYHVIWRTDQADLTDNFFATGEKQLIPTDSGGLMITYRDRWMLLNHQKPQAVLGRHSTCDMTILDKTASRKHARVALHGVSFYLIDESINGTFVIIDDRPEVHVLRREILLEGSGKISLGRTLKRDHPEVISFSRDRRSFYRT
jgi:class 3 adenylate cyclase